MKIAEERCRMSKVTWSIFRKTERMSGGGLESGKQHEMFRIDLIQLAFFI